MAALAKDALPKTMTRVVQLKVGNANEPGVLDVVHDAPLPSIEDGQVLIRVQAMSLNPIDYKLIQGAFGAGKGEFPKVVGSDCAGVVVAVGSACERLKVGDEVWTDAIKYGGLAEFVGVPEAHVTLKPESISFDHAATMPLAALTAWQGLTEKGKLQNGDKVLILGGSGGVGSLAIQIAKALGARTVATTSSNEKLVKTLGADIVVNYHKQDVADVLSDENYDIVFDCVGGYDKFAAASKILKPNGHFVTIVGDGGSLPSMLPGILYRKFVSSSKWPWTPSAPQYSIFLKQQNYRHLEQFAKLVDSGKVRAVVDGDAYNFDLDGVQGMFNKLMSHRTRGKLLMRVPVAAKA